MVRIDINNHVFTTNISNDNNFDIFIDDLGPDTAAIVYQTKKFNISVILSNYLSDKEINDILRHINKVGFIPHVIKLHKGN